MNCLKYKYPKEKSKPLSREAKVALSAMVWSELTIARGQINHTSQENKTRTIWERGITTEQEEKING